MKYSAFLEDWSNLRTDGWNGDDSEGDFHRVQRSRVPHSFRSRLLDSRQQQRTGHERGSVVSALRLHLQHVRCVQYSVCQKGKVFLNLFRFILMIISFYLQSLSVDIVFLLTFYAATFTTSLQWLLEAFSHDFKQCTLRKIICFLKIWSVFEICEGRI